MNTTRPTTYPDTEDLIQFSPRVFLHVTRGDTYETIGMRLLVRAHLAIAPGHKLLVNDLRGLVGARTDQTQALLDKVIAESFVVSDDGYVCRRVAVPMPTSPLDEPPAS